MKRLLSLVILGVGLGMATVNTAVAGQAPANGDPPAGRDDQQLAAPQKPSERVVRMTIRLHKGMPVIAVEGKEVKAGDLPLVLQVYVKKGRDELTIRVEPETPYRTVLAVQDAAKKAEVKKIILMRDNTP